MYFEIFIVQPTYTLLSKNQKKKPHWKYVNLARSKKACDVLMQFGDVNTEIQSDFPRAPIVDGQKNISMSNNENSFD